MASREYAFAYFYSEVPLTIALCVVVVALYRKLFKNHARHVNAAAIALALLLIEYSTATALSPSPIPAAMFLYTLSRNLNFVMMLLTLVLAYPPLWKARLGSRAYQVAFVLAVYFASINAFFAARNLRPSHAGLLAELAPLVGLLVPLSLFLVFSDRNGDERPQIQL